MFAYTVCCEISNPDVACQWVQWMTREHLGDVIAAGARAAVLVQLDGAPNSYETRYEFESRAAFDKYERDEAPRLRADGLKKFPLELGLRYRRTTGEVLAALSGGE